MLSWVRAFKTKMLEATSDLPDHKSYLHQLYVDDNNAIMEGLPPGTRMIGGKYNVMEELVAEDEQREADEGTEKPQPGDGAGQHHLPLPADGNRVAIQEPQGL